MTRVTTGTGKGYYRFVIRVIDMNKKPLGLTKNNTMKNWRRTLLFQIGE